MSHLIFIQTYQPDSPSKGKEMKHLLEDKCSYYTSFYRRGNRSQGAYPNLHS
jgi:hypothetical protein